MHLSAFRSGSRGRQKLSLIFESLVPWCRPGNACLLTDCQSPAWHRLTHRKWAGGPCRKSGIPQVLSFSFPNTLALFLRILSSGNVGVVEGFPTLSRNPGLVLPSHFFVFSRPPFLTPLGRQAWPQRLLQMLLYHEDFDGSSQHSKASKPSLSLANRVCVCVAF